MQGQWIPFLLSLPTLLTLSFIYIIGMDMISFDLGNYTDQIRDNSAVLQSIVAFEISLFSSPHKDVAFCAGNLYRQIYCIQIEIVTQRNNLLRLKPLVIIYLSIYLRYSQSILRNKSNSRGYSGFSICGYSEGMPASNSPDKRNRRPNNCY